LNLVDWQCLQVLKILVTGSHQIGIMKIKAGCIIPFF
jgi:hypothetical protein